MKATVLLTIPLVAALVGCDIVTGPDQTLIDPPYNDLVLASPAHAAAPATPPVLRVWQVSSGEGQIIGWCDQAAGVVRVSAPGAGTATHIGHFEALQAHCIDFATGAVTAGVATLTAANGDEIHFTYAGQVVPWIEPLTADLFYVATSGTGRFASGAGEMEIRVVHPTPTTWTSRGTGWISYSASDRAGM